MNHHDFNRNDGNNLSGSEEGFDSAGLTQQFRYELNHGHLSSPETVLLARELLFVTLPYNSRICMKKENLNCLKYLSRKYCIPKPLCNTIVAFILQEDVEPMSHSEHIILSTSLRLKAAQILKYCVRTNARSIDSSQFVQLLNCCKKDALAQRNSLVNAILNEIALALLARIEQMSTDKQRATFALHDQELICCLIDRFQYLEASIRIKLQKLNVNVRSTSNNLTDQVNLVNAGSSEQTMNSGGNLVSGSKISLGTEVLQRVSNTVSGMKEELGYGRAQKFVIKNQQAVASNWKELESEKNTIQQMSLISSLKSQLNSQSMKYANYDPDVKTLKSKEDSCIRWYRTTEGEIENFLTIAESNLDKNDVDKIILSDADIKYLCEKMSFKAFRFGILWSDFGMMKKIARIFSIISEYQELSTDVLVSIADEMFVKIYETNSVEDINKWEPCRLSVLTAIDYHSIRNMGIISQDLLKILKKYQGKSDCKLSLSATISHIISRGSNSSQNIDQFLRDFDNMHKLIKQVVQEDYDREKAINFIGKLIHTEQKCRIVVGRRPTFYTVFIDIAIDCNQNLVLRIQVAEVLKVYLSHSFTSTLTRREIEKLTELIRTNAKKVSSMVNKDESSFTKDQEDNEIIQIIEEASGWLKPLTRLRAKTIAVGRRLNRFRTQRVKASSSMNDISHDEKILKFKTSIVHSIIHCLGKVNQFDADFESIPQTLISFMNDNATPKDLQGLILISIQTYLSQNQNIYLPNSPSLAPKLLEKYAIDAKGKVILNNEAPADDSLDNDITYISAIVGTILVHQMKLGMSLNFRLDIVSNALESLKTHYDKTTKIVCSQLIFTSLAQANDSESIFDRAELAVLRQLSHSSPVVDIKIYCTSAYCLALRNSARLFVHNSDFGTATTWQLESHEVEALVYMYEWEKLILEGVDHKEHINPSIREILKVAAKYSHVEFSESIFQMLTIILQKETSIETISEILKLISRYTKLREGSSRSAWLPDICLEAIETSYTHEETDVLERCETIFTNILLRGQALSKFTLEELMKNFVSLGSDSAERYSRLFKILYLTNEIQDIPDFIFHQFDMELAGMKVLIFFDKLDEDFHDLFKFLKSRSPSWTQRPSLENSLYALRVVSKYVSCSIPISQLNFKVVTYSLSCSSFELECLQLLANAIENGKHIPKEILTAALLKIVDKETLTLDTCRIVMKLSVSLLDNNQTLPEDLIHFVCAKLMNPGILLEAHCLWMLIVAKLAEHQYLLPLHIVFKLCECYFESESPRFEILNAVVRILSQGSIYTSCYSKFKLVFVAAMKNEGHISSTKELEVAIRGFKLLHDLHCDNISAEEIQLVESYSFNPDLSDSTKKLVTTIGSTSGDLWNRFGEGLNKKSDKKFLMLLFDCASGCNSSLPPEHYWLNRLMRILQSLTTSDELVILALETILLLDAVPPGIIDAVGFTFANNSNPYVINPCKLILENVITEKNISAVSATLIEYLQSVVNSRPDCKEILRLICHYDLVPPTCRLNIEVQAETVINNLLVKLRKKSFGRTGDEVTRISELLASYVADTKSADLEILKNLLRLKKPILESINGVEVILSDLLLRQKVGLDAKLAPAMVEIIEEALISSSNKICEQEINTNTEQVHLPNLIVYEAYLKILQDPLCPPARTFTSVIQGLWNRISNRRNNKVINVRPKTSAVIDSIVSVLVFFVGTQVPLSFSKYKTRILFVSLNCFAEFTTVNQYEAPQHVIDVLEIYVQSPVPLIRKLAFRILKNCKYSMDFVVKNMFSEIFGDRHSFEVGDKGMNVQLLELLLSISYWDLESLNGLDRSEWSKHLLTADYIATYSTSGPIGDNFNNQLHEVLCQIFSIFKDIGAIQILLEIKSISSRSPVSSISKIIEVLELVCELEFKQVLHLLGQIDCSSKGTEWCYQLKELALSDAVRSKFVGTIRPEITQLHCAELVQAVGINMARRLVGVLTRIESVNELTELVHVLRSYSIPEAISFRILNSCNKIFTCEQLIHFFKLRYLLTFWPETYERITKVEKYLDRMISREFPVDKIVQLFLQLGITTESALSWPGTTNVRNNYKIGDNILCQICIYEVNQSCFNRVCDAMMTFRKEANEEPNDRIHIVSNIILETTFVNGTGRKDISQILEDLRRMNTDGVNRFSNSKMIIETILDGSTISTLCNLPSPMNDKHICEWVEDDIKVWSDMQLKQPTYLDNNNYMLEILMIARRAYLLWKGYNLTFVQVISCLIALGEQNNKGQLQQVVTGCGKSTIIAIVAVARALRRNKVDVYTSSPVLAERDAREWSSFYQMFSLTCDHNGDRGQAYLSGPKKCYQANIVYGDTSQFQFDTLRDEYSGLGTKGGREFEFALIDEVDCMLIDDSSKLARLSSSLPAMDSIQILYHFIWERLLYLQKHMLSIGDFVYYVEGRIISGNGIASYRYFDKEKRSIHEIKDFLDFIALGEGFEDACVHPVDKVESFTVDHLNNYARGLISRDAEDQSEARIKIPKNLMEFVDAQIPKWVDSALNAVVYEENVNYIVDDGQIKPVDYQTTGVVQSSTNWSHGLHQFLQLKHSLKITSETVTTNFLSNIAVFQKYGCNLVGLTGTLGSKFGRQVLSEVYNVQLYLIPENHFKCFYRLPDLIVDDVSNWREEILYSALHESEKGRGVLIIMQTISDVHAISKLLSKFKVTVKVYARNSVNQEKLVERIFPGDVVVATNLAGRGTNIEAAAVEEYGGLHVILTFLPDSLRVEEQAFGRTSRQGKKGTGQLIALSIGLNSSGSRSSEKLLMLREKSEERRLKDFRDKDLLIIQTKDNLFSQFCKFYRQVRSQLINMRASFIKDKVVSYFDPSKAESALYNLNPVERIVLQSLEELWAMFLTKVDDGRISISDAGLAYRDFENGAYNKCSRILNKQENGIEAVSLPYETVFYLIQLGNIEFESDSRLKHRLEVATWYYDKAIELDSHFAAAAYIGKANILLKGKVNVITSTNYSDDYKGKSLELYKRGLHLLAEEHSYLTTAQTFLFNRNRHTGISECSGLHEQLLTKMNLLGSYVQSVEANMNVALKSLRRVFYQEISDVGVKQGLVEGRQVVNSGFPGVTYNLSFHDLTVRYDLGDRDQVIQTIQSSNNLENACVSMNYACMQSFSKTILWNSDLYSDVLFQFEYSNLNIQSVEKTIASLASLGFIRGYTLLPILGGSIASYGCTTYAFEAEHISRVINYYKLQLLKRPFLFKLRLSNVNPFRVTQLIDNDWKAISAYASDGFRIEICNLSRQNMHSIIKSCRESKIEFVLQFSNLSFTEANFVLAEASMDQENIQLMETKKLTDLQMAGGSPIVEILELNSRGILFLITFGERKFIPWWTVSSIAILAGVQIAVGACLMATGVGASVGMGLITEGAVDAITSITVASTRDFSWAQFAVQKTASLVVSVATFGLQALKTGSNASRSVVQGVLTEAGEQAQTQLITNYEAVTSRVESLFATKMTQVLISTGTVGLHVGLNTMIDVLSKFSFQLLEDRIRDQIEVLWQSSFDEKRLYSIFSRHYALDRLYGTKDLEEKVRQLVRRITTAASTDWAKMWLNVSTLLCDGVIFESKAAVNCVSLVGAVGALVVKLVEIGTIIGKFADEMEKCLNSRTELERSSPLSIIKGFCDVSEEKAARCVESMIFSKEPRSHFLVKEIGPELQGIVGREKFKEIKDCFRKLNDYQKNFNFSECVEMTDLNNFIVNSLTNHIINVCKKELSNPLRNPKVGSLISQFFPEHESEADMYLNNDGGGAGMERGKNVKSEIEGLPNVGNWAAPEVAEVASPVAEEHVSNIYRPTLAEPYLLFRRQ